jgi:hypothetical protein
MWRRTNLDFKVGKRHRTVGYLSVFSSVVVGAFQITFCSKIHANDVFSFLKIIFDINTSKRYKTYKPY